MTIIKQVLCTFIVCIQQMCMGLMYAWPSSTIQRFSSSATPLNRPFTSVEQALFGSLQSVSALISTPLCGYLLDKLGRKYCCVLFAMPQIIAWSIVSVSSKVEVVLFAVSIAGLGGGMLVIAPMFISEFCQEHIRGRMTSCVLIFTGVGLMLSYILGGHLEYHLVNYICLSICIVAVIMLTIMKESPMCLMKKEKEQEAAKSIAFYRSLHADSAEVLKEMDMIRRALNPQMDDLPAEEEKLKPQATAKKMSAFTFIKKSQSTRRALVLVLTLLLLAVAQGMAIVQVYAQPIFQQAVPSISANLISIIFAVVNIFAGLAGAYLVDKFGRRGLIITAGVVGGISAAGLGTQIQFHWAPYWLSGVFLFVYCISFTIGAGTVPFVVIAEIFLPEVRSLLSMLAMEWAWTCTFTTLVIFNPLVGLLGLGPVFYMFSVVFFLTSIYSFFCLPETKALTVDVIQTLLVQKKR